MEAEHGLVPREDQVDRPVSRSPREVREALVYYLFCLLVLTALIITMIAKSR